VRVAFSVFLFMVDGKPPFLWSACRKGCLHAALSGWKSVD
jgi:hypothetical protein